MSNENQLLNELKKLDNKIAQLEETQKRKDKNIDDSGCVIFITTIILIFFATGVLLVFMNYSVKNSQNDIKSDIKSYIALTTKSANENIYNEIEKIANEKINTTKVDISQTYDKITNNLKEASALIIIVILSMISGFLIRSIYIDIK